MLNLLLQLSGDTKPVMGTTVIESVFTNKLLTSYKPKDVQMSQ